MSLLMTVLYILAVSARERTREVIILEDETLWGKFPMIKFSIGRMGCKEFLRIGANSGAQYFRIMERALSGPLALLL